MLFQAPGESIVIELHHSVALLLGGSFDPAYLLTITALPTQLQPTPNMYNASVIQDFMAKAISVPPDRGIIKFMPIQAEDLGVNGTTIQAEIKRYEQEDTRRIQRSNTRSFVKTPRKIEILRAKSSMKLARRNSKFSLAA